MSAQGTQLGNVKPSSNKGAAFPIQWLLLRTYGVAMESPLGPLLANMFLSSIEEKLNVEGKLPPY